MKQHIVTALKGFGMGAANVVPGVSGGTIALLTGIYSDIVEALDSFTRVTTWKALFSGQFKEFWKNIRGTFLLALGIGVLASVFSLAKFMTWALEYYPIPTWAFFFGLILASAYMMFRDIKAWNFIKVLLTLAGVGLGTLVCTLSPTSTPNDLWFIFTCGAIAICTMILPGISGSFILLVMGKYDYIMKAVSDFNVPVLAVFALGCGIGILAFAKFLHWLLAKWEEETMLVLLGFVIGSLVKVWPWSNGEEIAAAQALRTGETTAAIDPQVSLAVAFCLVGIVLVAVIELLAAKAKR